MKGLKEFLFSMILLASPIYSLDKNEKISPYPGQGLEQLVFPKYDKITHSDIEWNEIGKGLSFDRMEVYSNEELVDRIAMVKIDPKYNQIKVFSSYDEKTQNYDSKTIEGWQKETGASVIFNSAQYQANPWARPCALMISDGKMIGPKKNLSSRGMLLAEPTDNSLPLADLIDFEFDEFNYKNTEYTQGVQHWPILLNRNGKLKVLETDWQANRTIIAKDFDGNILSMTTEGGFFTLYNFGKFLKNSDLNIHTAMNLDGGYEAEMCIKTPNLDYTTYGQFETYGPDRDVTIRGVKYPLPSVIGVFPRE